MLVVGLILFIVWSIVTLSAFVYRHHLKSLINSFPRKNCLQIDNCKDCKAYYTWEKQESCSSQYPIIRDKIKKLETYQPIFNVFAWISAISLTIGWIAFFIGTVYVFYQFSYDVILQRGDFTVIFSSFPFLIFYCIICLLIMVMFDKILPAISADGSKFFNYFQNSAFFSLGITCIICLLMQLVMAGMHFATKENIMETTKYGIRIEAEQRSLTYFCNIPVQNISGSVSGSSGLFGTISGEISTSSELPYWYIYNGTDTKYDVAPAFTSKMIPLQEGETPYLEIVKYENQTTFDNQNPWGKVWTQTTDTWTQYEFHLPAQIVQGFSIN